jgi:hypothetical protein
MAEKLNLTVHERHSRLLKIVRRTYQAENEGARLFENTSGVAWQGNAVSGAGKVELLNPRPVFFGIPSPIHGEESGGSDLLGETIYRFSQDMVEYYAAVKVPVFTAIEIKTGKSRLRKNQKVFRDWVKSIHGIYFVARECPDCWDKWEPVYKNGKIVDWKIPECQKCEGKGYIEEE